MSKTYALIAGGGTGGHVNPALAIADALVELGHDKEAVRFVGSKRGLEARLVPEAGYGITLLSGRGIARKISWASLQAVVGLAFALLRAIVLVGIARPKVVVSVGGYASAPCAVAAVLWRVPLILAESNVVPGAANRLVGRYAAASAVSLPGTPLPRAIVTGNPVRADFAKIDQSDEGRSTAARALGLPPDKVIIAAFGGSLGAQSINCAIVDLVRRWVNRDDLAVYHVVGSRDWNDPKATRVDQEHLAAGRIVYQSHEYESRMATLLSAADIVVCRSGATTVAEVAVAGRPAVFVPFPGATADHQTANARALADAGAAVVIADKDCSGAVLADTLTPMVQSADQRAAMRTAAAALGIPDAAHRVAELAQRHARA